jgi:predicted nucleic acid-binding protein
MIGGKPLIYWDTSIWLAWARNERRKPGDMEGVQEYIDRYDKGEILLCTSVLTEAKIMEHQLIKTGHEQLRKFFDNPKINKLGADQAVARLIGEIRSYYFNQMAIDGLPTLGFGDALHLDSAILYECDEFLTFDENDVRKPSKAKRGLIPLSGNVAGRRLTICKPLAKAPKLRLVVPRPGKTGQDAHGAIPKDVGRKPPS